MFILYRFWQTILNLVFVLFSLILFIPITISLLVFNPVYNPGPLFYTQKRLGKHRIPFTIIKFRTMVVNAELQGAVWASENDERVTKLGAFLRRFRIDELPQFINVLQFQINLIGPRAERPELHEKIEELVPTFSNRLRIKPGITGYAQVVGGYSNDIEGARLKSKLDSYYIENQSIEIDLRILLRTVKEVLDGAGL